MERSDIIEAEVCCDHIHMLIEIPPKMSVSGLWGIWKGKSSQMIYEKWSNADINIGTEFLVSRLLRGHGRKGYKEDSRNTFKIVERDQVAEQLIGFEDPFTGNENKCNGQDHEKRVDAQL